MQSTGRDLVHFALTWDATYLYLYTARVASATNTQRFIYYADEDDDGLMESGERVIVAEWQGNTQEVDLLVGDYVESNPGGDDMVDADGYTLPGTIANLPPPGQPDYTFAPGGLASGLAMEFRIPWADAPGSPGMGLTAGTPFTFHISSTNSQPGAGSFPSQVDDNMGGRGGGAGSTQFPDLTFTPNNTLTYTPSTTVDAAHSITNDGNGDDTFNFTFADSGTFTPSHTIYHDVDSSGTFTPGDVALTDTDGDSNVDTGVLASGGSMDLVIVYTIPGGATGTSIDIVTASSSFQPARTETVADTLVESSSVEFQQASSTADEGVGTHSVVVVLTVPGGGALAADLTVDVTDAGTGSALTGTDYTFVSPTSLTFPAGTVSGATQLVSVPIIDDGITEGAETIDLTLGNASGGNVGSQATHQVAIDDNDGAFVAFQSSGSSVTEFAGTHYVVVELNLPSGNLGSHLTVYVVALSPGKATSATDYANFSTQTATFPAGSGQVAQEATITSTDSKRLSECHVFCR